MAGVAVGGWPLNRFFDSEPLGWGVALLVPSLIIRALRTIQPDPAQRGRCRTCEYDLIGNVSGVCPECGTPVSTTAMRANAESDDEPPPAAAVKDG